MTAPAVKVADPSPAEPPLIWDESHGLGYVPADCAELYDGEYFREYVHRADSPIASALNQARVDFLAAHVAADPEVIDIGIGDGAFIRARGGRTFGYDVNPEGIHWLKGKGIWRDVWTERIEYATCWDAFEHFPDPGMLIRRVSRGLAISMPIYRDRAHCLASKHFKPKEHYWYFTDSGLKWFLHQCGFYCVAQSDHESRLGRETIGAYFFRRHAAMQQVYANPLSPAYRRADVEQKP